jgi:hypothetical protein
MDERYPLAQGDPARWKIGASDASCQRVAGCAVGQFAFMVRAARSAATRAMTSFQSPGVGWR